MRIDMKKNTEKWILLLLAVLRVACTDENDYSVVEAHHIDNFTLSQNNDSTNIIIISPNYHRIIHKNNPRFNRKKFQFEFENGEVLRLKLYEHLKL